MPKNELKTSNFKAKKHLKGIKAATAEVEDFTIVSSQTKKIQVGEMKEMVLIAPDAIDREFSTGLEIRRFYNIMPLLNPLAERAIVEGGKEALSQEYIPKVQPEGMQFKFKPAGHNTKGKVFDEAMKRYGLKDTILHSSPKKVKKSHSRKDVAETAATTTTIATTTSNASISEKASSKSKDKKKHMLPTDPTPQTNTVSSSSSSSKKKVKTS